jgi:hypothetical protein
MNDRLIRKELVRLLKGGNAHLRFEDVIKEFKPKLRGTRPPGAPHTAWMLLEHLRIAQWDILEFTRDAKHVSPDFPSGYWPATEAPPDTKAWNSSVAAFERDLLAMQKLVEDTSLDMIAPLPHGDGQSILREAMLLADHNAYHIGQLMLLRRLL